MSISLTKQYSLSNSPIANSLNKVVVLKNEIQEVEGTSKSNKYENIEYKKQNPFIFGGQSSNPKFHKWYNFVKFGVVILAFIFSLLALWYATQWKAVTSVSLDEDGTEIKTINGALVNLAFNKEEFSSASGFAEAMQLSLGEWKSSIITNGMIEGLIAMSIVGLVFIIPTLVFKNGTAFSLGSLSILSISLIIVIVFYFIGVADQCEVTNILSNAKTAEDFEKGLNLVLGK